MRKVCFKVIVFFLMVHLSSCEVISSKELSIEGIWTIEAQESFLNAYDKCYLGEQIEFLDNGYYIFKTNCDSEIPYGLIKVGYYELKNDSILFFNQYRSRQVSAKIIKQTTEGLTMNYIIYQRENERELVEKKMTLKLKHQLKSNLLKR